MSKQSNDDRAVQSITDAQEGHTDEMRRRMVKYTVAMSIRLACLLLFFFFDGWLRWLFIAGAVFLPWVAVIIANSGSDQSNLQHSDALLDRAPVAELEAGPVHADEEPDVVAGEVIDDDGATVPGSAWPGASGEGRHEPPYGTAGGTGTGGGNPGSTGPGGESPGSAGSGGDRPDMQADGESPIDQRREDGDAA